MKIKWRDGEYEPKGGQECATCACWAAMTAECRRRPPVIIADDAGSALARIRGDGEDNWVQGVWPFTMADDWCGQYVAREPKR